MKVNISGKQGLRKASIKLPAEGYVSKSRLHAMDQEDDKISQLDTSSCILDNSMFSLHLASKDLGTGMVAKLIG